MDTRAKLGLWSGVGIVIANMIGAGVLTTPGFMALNLAPSHILLAWLVGGIVALSGARAYAAVAHAIPRSGGEYRFLSELWHPALGYLAGWTSLLVGFSLPVAADAIAVGAYGGVLGLGVDGRVLASVLVVLVTAAHAFNLRSSRNTQNALVSVKFLLVLGFVVVGLAMGSWAMPAWRPEAAQSGLPVRPFFESLVYIAFCYSGWNAAIYAAEEFAEPKRDVPRAMLIGCSIVIVVYMLVNWVFVANLGPAQFGEWFGASVLGGDSNLTVGHFLMRELIGDAGAKVMGVFMIIVLTSAMSAMTMIGPRVYAAMARDGYLPKVFAGEAGKPPVGSLLLQAAVALFAVWTQSFIGVIGTVGTILTLMAALTALGVFRLQFDARYAGSRPGVLPMAAATLYAVSSAWIMYFAFTNERMNSVKVPGVGKVAAPLLWLGFIVLVTAGYVAWNAATRPGRART